MIKAAAQTKAVEIFLNFPVMDMNRNALWHQPEKVTETMKLRMNRYWGGEDWRSAAYVKDRDLFGSIERKAPNAVVAEAFRQRLKSIAGFKFVPHPIPLRNGQGAVVYYLFFASPNRTADRVVRYIFDMFRDRGKT